MRITEHKVSCYCGASCGPNSYFQNKILRIPQARTFVTGDVATLHSHLVRIDGSLSHLKKVVAMKIKKVSV